MSNVPAVKPSMWASIVMGVLGVGAVAVAIRAAIAGWTTVSDVALIELRVRDVPLHLPFVGVYSRYGWNHPGPAEFYGLAPWYWLTGGASVGLLIGTLVFQFGSVIASMAIVRRFSTIGSLALGAGACLVYLGMPPEVLRSPWNPYVSLGGVVALVATGWAMGQRRRSGAALFAVASIVVQTHVVAAPVAFAVLVVAALVCAVSPHPEPVPWRAMWGGVLAAVIVWLPPFVQQLTGSPGNISELLRGGAGDGDPVGMADALAALSGAFAPIPSSLDRSNVVGFGDPLSWQVPIWALVVLAGGIGAVLLARGKPVGGSPGVKRSDLLTGWIIAAAATAGSVVSLALLTGGAFGYLRIAMRTSTLLWIAISVAALAVRATQSALAVPVARRSDSRRSVIGRAMVGRAMAGQLAGATCVVLAVALIVTSAMAGNPDAGAGEGTAVLADAIVAAIDDVEPPLGDDPTIEISHSVDFAASLYGPALMVELERRGVDVTSNHMGAALVGEHRIGPADIEFEVIGVQQVEAFEADGWTLAGTYEPFTDRELAALDALTEQYGTATFSLDVDAETARRQRTLTDKQFEITRGRVAAAVVWRVLPAVSR